MFFLCISASHLRSSGCSDKRCHTEHIAWVMLVLPIQKMPLRAMTTKLVGAAGGLVDEVIC